MTSCHATDSAIDVVAVTGRNYVFRPSPCLHGHHSVGVPRGSGDMTMETLVEAMARLESSGYTGAFAATPDGLRCPSCGRTHDPGQVGIDELVRFEGESNPSDEMILFALHCGECGAAGTYVVAYGPAIEPDDAEVVSRLIDRRR